MSVVDKLLETAQLDTDLLVRNDAKGDTFSRPRVVDFLLVADDPDRAQLVRDFITDNQYGDASVETVDGQHRILVKIEMPTTQHVLCSVSGLMACLAALYDLEYDGWGCVIQTT